MESKNIKVRVNPEESILVQKQWFSEGAEWAFLGRQTVVKTESPFLYLEDGSILKGRSFATFTNCENNEVTVDQILHPLQSYTIPDGLEFDMVKDGKVE